MNVSGRAPARWPITLVIGLIGAAVASAWNWRPSLWLDEVATLSAADRTLPQLFALVGRVDLVHAPYYMLMHGWIAVAGTSPFALRLPSALCVGITVAVMYRVIARFSASLGLAIALIALCVPRVTWAGSEAREQALAMALGMLAVLSLVRARETGRSGGARWVLVTVLCVLAALASLFAVFLPVAMIAWAWLQRRRTSWLPTFGWAAAVPVLMVPWALLAQSQSAQVSWIGARSSRDTALQVIVKQYAYGDDKPSGFIHGPVTLALIMAFALSAVALSVLALVIWRRHDDEERALLQLALCCLAVPLLALLAASVLVPLYVPKYLTYTAPWLAVPLSLGARAWRGRGRVLLVVACVAGLALQAPLRHLVEAPTNDYRTAADAVTASAASSYIITEPWLAGVAWTYPDAFTGRADLATARSAVAATWLYPDLRPPAAAAAAAHGRIVVLSAGTGHADKSAHPWFTALETAGCQRDDERLGATVTTTVWTCP